MCVGAVKVGALTFASLFFHVHTRGPKKQEGVEVDNSLSKKSKSFRPKLHFPSLRSKVESGPPPH